jgi:hypothetical protein
LDRVSIALFNNVVTIGNRELIYTIASTPEFNVGRFEYAAQYEFLSKRTTLLESGTAAAVSSTSLDAASTATFGAEESDGVEFRPPATERPLGNKSAKRNKRAREILEGNEVATSDREFSEQLKDSDASHALRAEAKLKLAKQSHQLKMYQTLLVHESSTASQEEKALAEKKLRSQFFSSLKDEEGGATGEYDNAGGVVRGVGSTASAIQPTAPPALHERYPHVDYNNAPHVHGSTAMAEKPQDSSL